MSFRIYYTKSFLQLKVNPRIFIMLKDKLELEFKKVTTPLYLTIPRQLVFKTHLFKVKEKLKVGNKVSDDITRE